MKIGYKLFYVIIAESMKCLPDFINLFLISLMISTITMLTEVYNLDIVINYKKCWHESRDSLFISKENLGS